MPLRLGTSFELAFRRAVFSLLLLLGHLLFSAFLLSLLGQFEWAKRTTHSAKQSRALQRSRRIDFERHELISTLWAESVVARSESDWSLAANAKLDAYERLLASEWTHIDGTFAVPASSTNPWTFVETMRTVFMAITTIGGGALTDLSPPRLGPVTQLFAALFILSGIPLTLIHVAHCVKAVNALIEANFGKVTNFALLAVVAGVFLLAAIIVDIATVGNEEDDVNELSFLDSLFAVLLAFGTISSAHFLRHFPSFLLLPFSIVLLTVAGLFFGLLQRFLERWMAPYEFAFANGICGKIERAVSGARLNEEDDEEEEEEERLLSDELEQDRHDQRHNHHHQLRNDQQHAQRFVQFGFGEDSLYGTDLSSTTNLPFGVGRRRSIVGQTIPEDEEEQQHQQQQQPRELNNDGDGGDRQSASE